MKKTITLKKGLNLNLKGAVAAGQADVKTVTAASVAITPDDFPGFTPKLEVAPGDAVKAGQGLVHDKTCEAIKLVSPVDGTVTEVVRGKRRKIERIVIAPTSGSQADCLKVGTQVESLKIGTTDVKKALMESGLWALMRQRPYDIVPDAEKIPRDIFVTAMDTAPMAVEFDYHGKEKLLEAGVKALASLTAGKVYIGADATTDFPEIAGAEVVGFNHLHPAGNAGVQAEAIKPVNKGETIWTLSAETLCHIGEMMTTGKVDYSTLCAVTGSEVEHPMIVKTVMGADVKSILAGNLKKADYHQRIISGNVLTGVPLGEEGYLRFPYTQITVIPEGDEAGEFMGWASVSPSKMSESTSFPGHFLHRAFAPDARLNGGHRAMIMSGIYDKYMPMDIMPEYLIKAILSRDIDKMEALGIYEVAPEDFALAEYADPSKLELQKIVREGLDYMRKEA
ncbi:MAG: Na(+)-translocating NADH-quinone reductase subunit A [Lachnoclostridium sp.]|nr:Na(+)-translocating NADH-quinone reductase subunit A [Lachnoclostridium sp.]